MATQMAGEAAQLIVKGLLFMIMSDGGAVCKCVTIRLQAYLMRDTKRRHPHIPSACTTMTGREVVCMHRFAQVYFASGVGRDRICVLVERIGLLRAGLWLR